MSYTKGEWRIAKRDGHSVGVRPVIYTKDVDRIAIISYRGVPSIEEADANARLIAAAPDLLDACKLCRHNENKRWSEIKEVLDRAITKAEK